MAMIHPSLSNLANPDKKTTLTTPKTPGPSSPISEEKQELSPNFSKKHGYG